MNKQWESIYELRYKCSNYDIVTANTEFYKFLGERLYFTFDSILLEDSRKLLKKKEEECAFNQLFVLDVSSEEGEFLPMVCYLVQQDNKEQMELHMIEISRLFEEYCSLSLDVKEKDILLSQFDCVYFDYERDTDRITFYQPGTVKKLSDTQKLQEWQEEKLAEMNAESHDKILKFVADLRNGIRNFYQCFTDKSSGKNVIVTGTALYSDGVHVKTVGNFGSANTRMSEEMVRRDQLTGLFLKEDITNYGKKRIDILKQKTAMAIIDIDDFKSVNDNFGHSKGDEVLRKCAAIVMEQVEGIGKAGRIGGDEFYIVFDGYEDKEQLRIVLRSIKNNIASAYSDSADGFHLTVSIGVSAYPEDTDNFDDLFHLADYLLYRAKSKGKNRYIFYKLEKHGTVEEILQSGIQNIGISSRKGMEKGEVVCKIADMMLSGEGYPLDNIFNDIVDCFGVERIVLYNRTDMEVVVQCGNKLLEKDIIADTISYIVDENLKKMYDKGVLVVNNIKTFKEKNPQIYEKLCQQEVLSFMHHEITGKSGREYVISYESVVIRNTWNSDDMYFFRIFDHILKQCL